VDIKQVEEDSLDRAAILLLSMGENAAAKILSRLGRNEVTVLSNRMARLSGVSIDHARTVIQGFFESFRDQSGISAASRSYLERTLDKALGQRLAKGMIDGIYGDSLKEEMQKLEWVSAQTLAHFFSTEHPQMQAVLLAFLPPDTASAVFAKLPPAVHDDLLYRVASLEEVNEQILGELRDILHRCIQYVSSTSSARVDGVRQAADIINRFDGDRAGLMDMLKIHDETLAHSVSENMYDFMTLARQSSDVLQVIVQEVSEDVLSLALKGADPEVRFAVMAVLPRRMAQTFTEKIEALGLVPVSRVEDARREVMRTVRELNENEVIRYQIFQERVVD
jgi:flagellar motor switch protein FliG